MVMAGMELRRLGLVTKPAYVVPNHMLEQFSARAAPALPPSPGARGRHRRGQRRRTARPSSARCATGDWDAVVHHPLLVLPHPGVGRQPRRGFLDARVDGLRRAIAASETGAGLTVKQTADRPWSARRNATGGSWTPAATTGSPSSTPASTTCSCDEAHAYKNLHFTHPHRRRRPGTARAGRGPGHETRLPAAKPTEGPGGHLRHRHAVANSRRRDVRRCRRYLQPDRARRRRHRQLRRLGGQLRADRHRLGAGPRRRLLPHAHPFRPVRQRPRAAAHVRPVADVRTPDQLGLPVPAIAGGAPETVTVVAPSDGLRRYVAALVARAEEVRSRACRPERGQHVEGIPATAAGSRPGPAPGRLDPPTPTGGKITAAAARIAQICTRTAAGRYLTPTARTRRPARRPATGVLRHRHPHNDGAGTFMPSCARCSPPAAYPRGGARSSTTPTTTRPKPSCSPPAATAASRCWSAQPRKWAWAPTSRPGPSPCTTSTARGGPPTSNNAKAASCAKATRTRPSRSSATSPKEASTSSCWQTVERKAGFIHQVIRGEVAGRAIDDVGDQALSFAEVKALATGNPLIMEQAGIESDLARLATPGPSPPPRTARTGRPPRPPTSNERNAGPPKRRPSTPPCPAGSTPEATASP